MNHCIKIIGQASDCSKYVQIIRHSWINSQNTEKSQTCYIFNYYQSFWETDNEMVPVYQKYAILYWFKFHVLTKSDIIETLMKEWKPVWKIQRK